jgi:hypothetical protein
MAKISFLQFPEKYSKKMSNYCTLPISPNPVRSAANECQAGNNVARKYV